VKAAHRDQILVNEVRTELKGSVAAWIGLASVTAFLAWEFAALRDQIGYQLWFGTMTVFLTGWLIAWTRFVTRPPPEDAIVSTWIPCAKAGMMLCNLATAASVWVFLPASPPELRALMIILYAWYLIIQFAAASEATQVLTSAVVMVLGSLTAWLLVARPPYALPLACFLPLFGATLIAVRRFIRQAVVAATAARAETEEARGELALALTAVARERDAKTQFIRAASHDLQQPLQAAALFLDRIKPGGRAAEQAPSIGGLRQALTAARALVTAMLEHLKLEGGVIRPRIERLTAGDVFDRVLLTQGPVAAAAGIRIRRAGSRVVLTADPALLARALENLIANAVRHAEARRILLGCRRERGSVRLWVIDDGKGLGEGDEARIFSPFEQGAHVGASGGFGLGLASTRGLVALMDGQCGVAKMIRGAAFYISLPVTTGTEAEDLRCAA
jgi:signal transduction histidine kinase